MLKTLNAIFLFVSLAGVVGVYALKYSVEDLATDKGRLERKIDRQNAELSLLQADWAYLNQPAHVAPIVVRHQAALGLESTKQEQYLGFDALPMRPAAPDNAALNSLFETLESGVDPIGQIIEAN
jgi:hypothetical protein